MTIFPNILRAKVNDDRRVVNLKRYLIRATGKSMDVEFKHRGKKPILNLFQRTIMFNVLLNPIKRRRSESEQKKE